MYYLSSLDSHRSCLLDTNANQADGFDENAPRLSSRRRTPRFNDTAATPDRLSGLSQHARQFFGIRLVTLCLMALTFLLVPHLDNN